MLLPHMLSAMFSVVGISLQFPAMLVLFTATVQAR